MEKTEKSIRTKELVILIVIFLLFSCFAMRFPMSAQRPARQEKTK